MEVGGDGEGGGGGRRWESGRWEATAREEVGDTAGGGGR